MGLANWLMRRRMRRAARVYARELPRRLASGWGASEFYSAGQVHAALESAELLDAPHLSIAYAGNLSQDDYVAQAGALPDPLPYDLARDLYLRSAPSAGWMNHVHRPGTITPQGIVYGGD